MISKQINHHADLWVVRTHVQLGEKVLQTAILDFTYVFVHPFIKIVFLQTLINLWYVHNLLNSINVLAQFLEGSLKLRNILLFFYSEKGWEGGGFEVSVLSDHYGGILSWDRFLVDGFNNEVDFVERKFEVEGFLPNEINEFRIVLIFKVCDSLRYFGVLFLIGLKLLNWLIFLRWVLFRIYLFLCTCCGSMIFKRFLLWSLYLSLRFLISRRCSESSLCW